MPPFSLSSLIGQVLKVDLEDGIVVHVDDCGPNRHAKSM
jgi:hypothetical protein